MNKISIMFLICVLPFTGSTQVILGYTNNIDIYKPYTEEAQDYMKHNDQVKSNTWSIYAQCPVIRKSKWSLSFGFNYKNINHLIKDKFLYFPYKKTYFYNGWHTDTVLIYDPTDLKSTSKSFGLNGEFRYHWFTSNGFSGQIGINCEVYLREYYRSEYDMIGYNLSQIVDQYEPMVSRIKKFYLASSNVSVFYRHTWQFSPAFSLGAKASVGTNLSSDWDQFRKYVWLGVGLEVGFGRAKSRDI